MAAQMHDIPVPFQRKTFHWQNHQPSRFQFQLDNPARNDSYAQSMSDALLNRTVVAEFHVDPQFNPRLVKIPLHGRPGP